MLGSGSEIVAGSHSVLQTSDKVTKNQELWSSKIVKSRTRESLGINIPALMSLHRNGKTLNFVINPPAQMASIKQLNIYPKCFLLLLGSAPSGKTIGRDAVFIVVTLMSNNVN